MWEAAPEQSNNQFFVSLGIYYECESGNQFRELPHDGVDVIINDPTIDVFSHQLILFHLRQTQIQDMLDNQEFELWPEGFEDWDNLAEELAKPN